MNYFLDTKFSKQNAILSPEESKHALRSLRLRIGDELIVGDGNGLRYRCSLASVDDKLAHLNIQEILKKEPPTNQLTIALAPTKSPSRFEWFLEKATEMGIVKIIPLQTQNSERTRINAKRALKIVHSASKQSQRFFIPEISSLVKLADLETDNYDHCFLAHCAENFERTELIHALANVSGKILVLIGPEGDFSADEIKALIQKGFTGVSLGNNRLRTETAGVYTTAIFSAQVD